jgi:hypothetical protein
METRDRKRETEKEGNKKTDKMLDYIREQKVIIKDKNVNVVVLSPPDKY